MRILVENAEAETLKRLNALGLIAHSGMITLAKRDVNVAEYSKDSYTIGSDPTVQTETPLASFLAWLESNKSWLPLLKKFYDDVFEQHDGIIVEDVFIIVPSRGVDWTVFGGTKRITIFDTEMDLEAEGAEDATKYFPWTIRGLAEAVAFLKE